MKKLALFDFDNVIYSGHSIFDIIRQMEKDSIVSPAVWEMVEKQLALYKQNRSSYKEATDAILQSLMNNLVGKSYLEIKDYIRSFFKNNPDKFFDWPSHLLSLLKENYHVYIVTANLQFVAEIVVEKYYLSGYLSSTAQVVNGLFTGSLDKSMAGEKGEVSSLFNKYPYSGSLAVGDSENDIDMLQKVEFPICYQPDEKLTKMANSRGWRIVNGVNITEVVQETIGTQF
jgi:HAD superfamily phosphoserine phosphatase-like hydrolase